MVAAETLLHSLYSVPSGQQALWSSKLIWAVGTPGKGLNDEDQACPAIVSSQGVAAGPGTWPAFGKSLFFSASSLISQLCYEREPFLSLKEILLSVWNPLLALKLILLLEIRNLKVLVVFCPPHCHTPPLGSYMQSKSYTYVCMRRLWEREKLSEEKNHMQEKHCLLSQNSTYYQGLLTRSPAMQA